MIGGKWWVAGAVALGGAAEAQTSVTLYGIADANLRLDHTAIGTLRSLGSGGEDASRFGLRGVEHLGNGLDVVFNFEQDVDLGDNSVPQGNITPTTSSSPVSSTGSRLFGRRAVIGLRSDTYGELRFGRERTAMYDTWRQIDPWEAGTVASARNFAVGNVYRFDNAVTWESPTTMGFTLTAQYRAGEATTEAPGGLSRGNGGSASLTYALGPLYVGAAYLVTRPDVVHQHAGTVGASVDFDAFKLHALGFYSDDPEVGRSFSYGLGVTVPIGAFRIIGMAARIDNRGRQRTDDGGLQSANDANYFSLGTEYSLSKRTSLYVVGARFVNRGGASFDLEDNSNEGLYTPLNLPAGFNPWSMQFGIRHAF